MSSDFSALDDISILDSRFSMDISDLLLLNSNVGSNSSQHSVQNQFHPIGQPPMGAQAYVEQGYSTQPNQQHNVYPEPQFTTIDSQDLLQENSQVQGKETTQKRRIENPSKDSSVSNVKKRKKCQLETMTNKTKQTKPRLHQNQCKQLNDGTNLYSCEFGTCSLEYSKNETNPGQDKYSCCFPDCVSTNKAQDVINESFQRHARREHNCEIQKEKKIFECDFEGCKKDYNKKQDLKEHKVSVHKEGKFKFKCKSDGKVFNSKCKAQRHINAKDKRKEKSDTSVESLVKICKSCETESPDNTEKNCTNCDGKMIINSIHPSVSQTYYEDSNGEEYPPKHIILIGKTGEGKSTLGNYLFGDDCFQVCNNASVSVTKSVKEWQGSLKYHKDCPLIITDTPGMDDTSQEDSTHIDSIVKYLQERKYVNGFILVIKKFKSRFTKSLQEMLNIFELCFGTSFWRHLVIKVKNNEQKENWMEQLRIKFPAASNIDIPTITIDCLKSDNEAKEELLQVYQTIEKLEAFDCQSVEDIKSDRDRLISEHKKMKGEHKKVTQELNDFKKLFEEMNPSDDGQLNKCIRSPVAGSSNAFKLEGDKKEDGLLFTISFLVLEPGMELLQRILARHVEKPTFESLNNSLQKLANDQIKDGGSITNKRIYELTFKEINIVYEHIFELKNVKIIEMDSVKKLLKLGNNHFIKKIKYAPEEMMKIINELIECFSKLDGNSMDDLSDVLRMFNDPSINYSEINTFIVTDKELDLSRKLVSTIIEECTAFEKSHLKEILKINNSLVEDTMLNLEKIQNVLGFAANECFEFLIRVEDPTSMQDNFTESDKGKEYIDNLQFAFQNIEDKMLPKSNNTKLNLREIKFNFGSVLIHGIFVLRTGKCNQILYEENITKIEEKLTSIFKINTNIQLNKIYLHSFLRTRNVNVCKNINKIEPAFQLINDEMKLGYISSKNKKQQHLKTTTLLTSKQNNIENSGRHLLIHGLWCLKRSTPEFDIQKETFEEKLTAIFKMKTTVQMKKTFLSNFFMIEKDVDVCKNINKIEPSFQNQKNENAKENDIVDTKDLTNVTLAEEIIHDLVDVSMETLTIKCNVDKQPEARKTEGSIIASNILTKIVQDKHNSSIVDDDSTHYEIEKSSTCHENYQYIEIDPDTNMPIVQIHPALYEVLKPHQAKGVNFLWKACFRSIKQISEKYESGAILAHCMGLGKSLQAITLIHTVLNNSETGMKNVLILCPVETIRNWENEFQTWLKNINGLNIFTLMDSKKKIDRYQVLHNWRCMGGVLIMGYDQFRSLNSGKQSPEVKACLKECLLDPGPDIVICDEGHLLKNERASITKQIRSKRRIILTGTPLQNNLNEYFAMINFIKPGLLESEKEFRTKFVLPIEKGLHKDSNSKDVQVMKERYFVLSDLLKDHMQRLDHGILTPYLPPKHEYVISAMLTPVQRKMYKYYLNNKSSYKTNKPSLLKDLRNLAKICNHPLLMATHVSWDTVWDTVCQNNETPELPNLTENENSWCDQFLGNNNTWQDIKLSSKMTILMEILRKSKEKEDKVLVFSQSLQTLDAIEKFLETDSADEWVPCKDYYRLDGNTTAEDRKKMINYFNMVNNHQMRLFLVSTNAGGMRINLPAANRVVIFDVSWNPSNDLQSIFRVYRLGQTKPVYVYRLLAKGTMEEKIYDRQVAKQSLSARIIDEHQIDRHHKDNELKSLYEFQDYNTGDKPTPKIPNDSVLGEILIEFEGLIWNYHDHDLLLQNKVDEVLSEEEQKQAWISFKEHQKLLREQMKLHQLLTRKVQLNAFHTWLTLPKKMKPNKGTNNGEGTESSIVLENENSSGFPTMSSNENSLSSQPSLQNLNKVLKRRTSLEGDEWEKCSWSGCLQWTSPSDSMVHQLQCTITKKALEFAGVILDTLPKSLDLELLPKRFIKKLVLDYDDVSTVVIQADDGEDTNQLACAFGNDVAGYVTTNNKDTEEKELLMLLVKRREQDTDLFIGFIPYNNKKIQQQMTVIRETMPNHNVLDAVKKVQEEAQRQSQCNVDKQPEARKTEVYFDLVWFV